MEERERGCVSAKKKKRGLCWVKMKKNRWVYIVEGEGLMFGHMGWVWVGK